LPRPRCRSLQVAAPHPDDVVIVCAVRTPICKAKKGGLKDTPAEDLLATVLAAVVERTKIDPAVVGDVVVGSVLGSNVWRANQARIAMFLAGYPDSVRALGRDATRNPKRFVSAHFLGARAAAAAADAPRRTTPQVPVRTLNRQCSSGLQAVADVASAIKARRPVAHALLQPLATPCQDQAQTAAASRARNPASRRMRARALTLRLLSLQAGYYDIGVAAGVESMSMDPMKLDDININPKARRAPAARERRCAE
jgi:acetyl-CoA acetyltransferase